MPIETHSTERGHGFYPSARELTVIPRLYDTEQIPVADKIVYLHYFTSDCDWWVVELDADSGLAFGYVRLHGDDLNAEWGYVDLADLESLYRPAQVTNAGRQLTIGGPLIVERDLHWTPRAIPEVLAQR